MPGSGHRGRKLSSWAASRAIRRGGRPRSARSRRSRNPRSASRTPRPASQRRSRLGIFQDVWRTSRRSRRESPPSSGGYHEEPKKNRERTDQRSTLARDRWKGTDPPDSTPTLRPSPSRFPKSGRASSGSREVGDAVLEVAEDHLDVAPADSQRGGDRAVVGARAHQREDVGRQRAEAVGQGGGRGVPAMGAPGVAQVGEIPDRTSTRGRPGGAARGTSPRSSARSRAGGSATGRRPR